MPLFGSPNVEKLISKRDIKGLIKALSFQKDAEVRKTAAEALGEFEDEQSIEPLLNTVDDENQDVCISAIKSLIKMKYAGVIETSIDIIKNNAFDEDSRKEIALLLGSLGESSNIPLHSVKDKSQNIWIIVVKSLINIKYEGAIKLSVEIIKNDELAKNVRREVALLLSSLGESSIAPLFDIIGFSIKGYILGRWLDGNLFQKEIARDALLQVNDKIEFKTFRSVIEDWSELQQVTLDIFNKEQYENPIGILAMSDLFGARVMKRIEIFKEASEFMIKYDDQQITKLYTDSLISADIKIREFFFDHLKEMKGEIFKKLTIIFGCWISLLDLGIREASAKALEALGWKGQNDLTGAYYWTFTRNWVKCEELGSFATEPLFILLRTAYMFKKMFSDSCQKNSDCLELIKNTIEDWDKIIDCLQKITGNDFGDDMEKWWRWKEEHSSDKFYSSIIEQSIS